MPGAVATYQPVAAPDALSARRNMAMGGQARYWAAPGVAPTWSPGAGWTFNGTDQYLTTGIVPGFSGGITPYTMLVRFSGAATDGGTLAGQYTGGARFELQARALYSDNHYYHNGDSVYVSGRLSSGVMAVAGNQGYLNGAADGKAIAAGYATTALDVWIANRNGAADLYAGNIQAMAIYSRKLTEAEVWLASQQMARCETVADYSVWTPARRWFFIGPPPPAAATPVLSTIYINSADIGDTSLFDDVSGAAVSSTYARTGANSFKLTPGTYLQADLTSSATKYTKFGLLVTNTPASDALLVSWQETGTEHVSLYLTDDLTLQMRQGSTVIQTSPTTLETETWYCVETKVVVHDTIGRFQVRIDGVDDMTAIGINTDDDVDGVINEIRFESAVDDTYIDDIVVREDQWCGTGGVHVIAPTAAGTIEEWTGAYTDVDDLPPSFTDYLSVTSESGSDQLFRHGGIDGNYDVSVVAVFAKGRLDSEAADTPFYALMRSSLTDNVGYAQDLDTTGVYARQVLTIDPNGTVAWTAYAIDNALQIGVRG